MILLIIKVIQTYLALCKKKTNKKKTVMAPKT